MSEPSRDDQKTAPSFGAESGAKPFPEFLVPPPGADPGPKDGARAEARAFQEPPALPRLATDAPLPPLAAKPPRARGTGLALFCALIALVGAGGTIAAPSLRPILAEQLRAQFGDKPWVGIVTGTADTRPPEVIEVDLQRFDQRINALSTALATTPAGQPVDRDTLNRFVEASGESERFLSLTDQLRRAEDQVLQLSKALGALETRLAKIDSRADQMEASGRALAVRLEQGEGTAREHTSRLSMVEGGMTKAVARADELAGAQTAAGGRLDGVEQKLVQVADAGAAAVAAVASRATALESGAQAVVAQIAGLGDSIKAVTDRTAAVEAAVQAATVATGEKVAAVETALAARIDAVDGRVTATDGRVTAVDGRVTVIDGRMDGIDGAIGPLRDSVQANSQGVQALGTRIDEVEEKIPAPTAGPVLLTLATRIRTALDEGEPFAAEVQALRQFGGNDPVIAASAERLAPLATRGAPSLSLLRRDFNTAAKKVLEAEEAAAPPWYERQMATVQSYFGWTVAPPAVPGEAARAALGRAAASITNGNFAEAVKDLAALQPPGAVHADAWLRMAMIRVEAERALRGLNEAALRRLASAEVKP
ncbi:hypothetical protein HL658_22565 [Azospirillum sp. RWY-5-1]|uniref:Chromosome partition protein Smc n=1 Tax=Azospirillum oleiclasticum TaxID=2735135 RepID=A0ABX2TDL6_9PROT|nr:hypothetical protein [Azospirillum oleiclasticum]NYZ15331.1 hypothetical protein [Azospirillum oleiclasticum]NYZ21248.1 hypothetical protein [Azospirillum oleiclasticum]